MKRTEVLQRIARAINAETYLEIGVRNPGDNFRDVDAVMSGEAIGVDPAPKSDRVLGENTAIMAATSDEFFARLDKATKGRKRLYVGTGDDRVKVPKLFDLIFIDGDHSHEQSFRDAMNALAHITPRGVVVLHDCLPISDEEALPAKPKNGKPWCGEVWKTMDELVNYSELSGGVVNCDHGVGVLWPVGECLGRTEQPKAIPDNLRSQFVGVYAARTAERSEDYLQAMLDALAER